jgi:hypothetical protein
MGFPLHTVDGPDVVASFGIIERGSFSAGTMHMLRRITAGSDGTIFSGGFFEYAVDVWSPSGERRLGFKRLGLWEPPPGGQPQPLSADIDLWGLVLAMRVDDCDRLWVIAWIPRDDWRSNVTEGVGPDGRTYLRPESSASLYRTALEVIDLSSGHILAHSEFDELIYGFLGGGSLFGNRFTSVGEPRLVVWNVSLRGRLDQKENES